MTSLVFASLATAASADEPAALVTLGETSVLTLPANDGVRDTTSLTVTSDVPTTVSLVVKNGEAEVKDLGFVTLTAEELSKPIGIAVTDLPAGELAIVGTPTSGEAATTGLTVGSGVPSSVSVSLSAGTIFTWSKATPRTTKATVTAVDETALTVPFTGSVKAVVGGKTQTVAVKSTTGATAAATISVTKLAAGTGKVTATVSALKTGSAKFTSPAVTLKVLKTAVTALKIKASNTTVFPAKDSYKDSTKITITPTTTTGKSFASTGTVTITYKGKTVKSWKLTSSNAKSLTWDGKNKGKIVPGTYTVTAKLKGPEGATKTVKSTIKVDKGKLVTKTKTVKYKANAVLKAGNYVTFDELNWGECWTQANKPGYILCDGYDAYYDDTISLVSYGNITIPSDVRNAQKYGGASATVTLETTFLYGVAAWTYDTVEFGGAKGGLLKMGSHNLGALKLASGTSKIYLTVGLGEYSSFDAKSVTVKYTYKVMTK